MIYSTLDGWRNDLELLDSSIEQEALVDILVQEFWEDFRRALLAERRLDTPRRYKWGIIDKKECRRLMRLYKR